MDKIVSARMRGMKKFEELGCAPAPWTAEANALGEMVLTCHDTDADGKQWSEDFAQAWGATATTWIVVHWPFVCCQLTCA